MLLESLGIPILLNLPDVGESVQDHLEFNVDTLLKEDPYRPELGALIYNRILMSEFHYNLCYQMLPQRTRAVRCSGMEVKSD